MEGGGGAWDSEFISTQLSQKNERQQCRYQECLSNSWNSHRLARLRETGFPLKIKFHENVILFNSPLDPALNTEGFNALEALDKPTEFESHG